MSKAGKSFVYFESEHFLLINKHVTNLNEAILI